MALIKIKPAKEGNIIRHPGNMRPLSQEGEEVEHSSFWERRIKDGDVILIDGMPNHTHVLEPNDTNAKKSKNKNEDNT